MKASIKGFLISFPVEIVVYMLSFGIGVGTIPWLLVGELCPIEVWKNVTCVHANKIFSHFITPVLNILIS